MNNIFKNEKVRYGLIGALAYIVGKQVLTSKATRNVAVKGLAKGMKLQNDAKSVYQNMKDEAQDLCYDAKLQAELDETENDEA